MKKATVKLSVAIPIPQLVNHRNWNTNQTAQTIARKMEMPKRRNVA